MPHKLSKLKDSSPLTFWISNPLRQRLVDFSFSLSAGEKRRVTLREIIEDAVEAHLDKYTQAEEK